MMNCFDWIGFYEELATKLVFFRNQRAEMVNKIIDVFAHNNIKLPKLESGTEEIDMDPFTVFSLFNRGLTDQKRKALCRGYKEVFLIASDVPEDFRGIPVTNPLNSFFLSLL